MAKPLLKWPGGKRWLAAKISPHLTGTYRRYIEAFLGGGAVLFMLEPHDGIASDINEELIACYMAVKQDGPRVLNELNKLRTTKKEYYRIRDGGNLKSEFKQSARLIYLLRHSWNGLYRVNRDGQFNVPYCPRQRKDKLTEVIII